MASPTQAPRVHQDENLIAQLKDEIFQLWTNDRESRYMLGRKLHRLQRERAKPGHGQFLSDLEELDLPYWTAYRRITFYEKVQSGLDLFPVRLLQDAKDKMAKAWGDIEDADLKERALKHAEKDEDAKQIAELTKGEKEKIAGVLRDKQKSVPVFRVLLGFSARRRKQFKDAYTQLGDNKAAQIIFKAVTNEARKHKTRG
jgi:hypothetical protein